MKITIHLSLAVSQLHFHCFPSVTSFTLLSCFIKFSPRLYHEMAFSFLLILELCLEGCCMFPTLVTILKIPYLKKIKTGGKH